jgi:hypothetical protein
MKAVEDALNRTYGTPVSTVKYIPQAVYSGQKASLTRAKNSGDPQKVIDNVVRTVREWNAGGYAWPDSWAMWNIALQDAVSDVKGWRDGMAITLHDIR